MDNVIIFKNGLRLVVENIPHTRAVAIGVAVEIGSSDESLKNNGITHFLEHMLFKGTINRSSFDIVNQLESIGASVNAFTSKELTMYYTISSKEHFVSCLEILSDIFFNSCFANEEIEKEKGVILEEINSEINSPDSLCYKNIYASYFGEKSYGLSILGLVDNIKSFNNNDFLDYTFENYRANNVVISIAGAIDIEEAVSAVEKLFSSNFSEEKLLKKEKMYEPSINPISVYKDISQDNIAIAFPSISSKENTYVAQLFNYLTSGGMSSRLFQHIREKLGLVYDISLSSSIYRNTGMSALYLATSPNLTEKALQEVRKVLDLIKNEGFSKEELYKGKEQVKLRISLLTEQSFSTMRMNATHLITYAKKYNVDEALNLLNDVKLIDLIEYANKYIKYDKISSSYVGPNSHVNVIDYLSG